MKIQAVNQIIVLFIVIFVGYYVRKIELLDDYVSKKLASIVIYISLPMLIINSMSSEEINIGGKEVLTLIIITLGIYSFLLIMTMIIPKVLKVQEGKIGVYKFMILFSNVAFVAFPILYALYGEVSIFYGAILNLPFNFLVFTLGVYFVSMDHHSEHSFNYKNFISPAVVASIIGLILFVTKLPVPVMIRDTMNILGSLTTPLSMLVIGTSLVHTKILEVIKDWRLLVLCFLKQLVFPGIVYLVLAQIGFEGLMLIIPTLLTAMPIASNAVIISLEYGGNNVVASEGVFISTLTSLVTLTIIISIIV